MDTFTTLWNRILLRVPAAGPDLAQDLVRDAFNQLVERRQWTWLMKSSAFYAPNYTNAGLVSVVSGSAVVNGAGTAFASNLIGVQIRIGSVAGGGFPTYTITQAVTGTQVILDKPWTGPNLSSQPYQIYQCYFPVPSDFQYFYSVTNPTANYRLNHNATEAEIDSYDPQRAQSGIPYALAYYDTTSNYAGSVGRALQIRGSGASPVFTTATGFSYPQDSVYTVEITTGGASGAAIFSWRQDQAVTSGAGVVTSSSPINLSNGVQVYFSAGTYNLGDVFVSVCKADATTGVLRYEMWPRPVGTTYVYPYAYACKLPALSDDQPQLPGFIARRGDTLVEMALTNLALWPGTADQPNPYRDVGVSNIHRIAAEKLIYELEKKDDDTGIKDLTYQYLPFMGPWRDGSWLQSHAMYPDY